jgi:hypothetical protein
MGESPPSAVPQETTDMNGTWGTYPKRGSGWVLAGALLLLLVTAVAAIVIYDAKTGAVISILDEPDPHPLNRYSGVAVLAWIIAGFLIIAWRYVPDLRYRHVLQLLLPLVLLGIWALIVARTGPYPVTIPVRVSTGVVSGGPLTLDAGQQVLGVTNATGLEQEIGLLYSPVPFELYRSGQLADLSTRDYGRHFIYSAAGSTCFLACSLPALHVAPYDQGSWIVDLEPGYYAVVAVNYDVYRQQQVIDRWYAPAIITVPNE